MATTANKSDKTEVSDVVASVLPNDVLPSEKDIIQLGLLLKASKSIRTPLESEEIGNIFSD